MPKQFEMVLLGIQACFAGHAQTLPDETTPKGKIHLVSKIAVAFEHMIGF